MSRFVSTSTAGTGRAYMIAAIATDTERAGTVVAMDITIKAASTIAVAETIAMVATRASNGRDAAKAACRPLTPGNRQAQSAPIQQTRPAMAGALPDIAASYPREGDHSMSSSRISSKPAERGSRALCDYASRAIGA